MPGPININGITGLDGHRPIYNPDGRWTIWGLHEIFNGQQGQNRFVPKVGDWVFDKDTAHRYRVASVDPTTALSTLVTIFDVPENDLTNADILFGVGPGTQADTYRVYIDKSVIPHTLAVDARLTVSGTMVSNCKLFKGNVANGSSECVSAFYDGSGTLLGQTIPLETAVIPNSNNYTVKTVPVCYTTHDLPDNEIITAVFYSDLGVVVSKRQLLVENTTFIRAVELGTKYITSIALDTPFLSTSDPLLIQYPINVPLNGMNLMGVVTYSDGSSLRLPVDGTKFSVWGFDNYVATIVGQEFPVTLKYQLSPGEVMYSGNNVGNGNGAFKTVNYRATTLNSDGSFTPKLFAYPVWVDAIHGYRLEWYLTTLERSTVFKVTPYVTFNVNVASFDPLLYGTKQTLSVSINLRNVNGSLRPYIHTQSIDIMLLGPGTMRTTNWTIGFAPNQNPLFGIDNFAKSTMINAGLWRLNLKSNYQSKAEWLDKVYYKTLPLFDGTKETKAPEPNFFKVIVDNVETEFPISDWDKDLTLSQLIPDNGTVFIKFIKRTVNNDIQLAVSAMPIYRGPDDLAPVGPTLLSTVLHKVTRITNGGNIEEWAIDLTGAYQDFQDWNTSVFVPAYMDNGGTVVSDPPYAYATFTMGSRIASFDSYSCYTPPDTASTARFNNGNPTLNATKPSGSSGVIQFYDIDNNVLATINAVVTDGADQTVNEQF